MTRRMQAEILRNIIIGLTVSFVALSLGAALGILSGRGAFAGMFSAGIIAFIAAILGGTRVQCSGPTAPMSAVSAIVVSFAAGWIPVHLSGYDATHFINITFVLTGVVLVIMAALRLGRFISLVPNVVISGFMSGIAVLIWCGQLETLLGINNHPILKGNETANILLVIATLLIIFLLPPLLKRILPRTAAFIPATLVAIILLSVISNMLGLQVEYVDIHSTLTSMSDFEALLARQFPDDVSVTYLMEALPFAMQLAMLCYLDTLLTTLVIDKMSGEKTRQDKELVAQGVANGAVAFVGGIPGAQATIRSVLMLKEGATMRIAGVSVGCFVLAEMLIFQHAITYIPQAVFVGILLKVGYDVFDFLPIRLYLSEALRGKVKLTENIFRRHEGETIFVTNMEMLFIIGTTLVTVLFDLNVAVGGFTLLFYAVNKWITPNKPIRDLKAAEETEAVLAE